METKWIVAIVSSSVVSIVCCFLFGYIIYIRHPRWRRVKIKADKKPIEQVDMNQIKIKIDQAENSDDNTFRALLRPNFISEPTFYSHIENEGVENSGNASGDKEDEVAKDMKEQELSVEDAQPHPRRSFSLSAASQYRLKIECPHLWTWSCEDFD
ncbi:hypothetical protein ACOME3_007817 [Neoechinorhynchus agilis]